MLSVSADTGTEIAFLRAVPDSFPIARLLIALGILLVLVGLAWQFLPWRPGRLPGDFAWGKGNVRVFLPCGTSLLLSVALTLLLWLLAKIGR